jgi:II/X family phage/plasmid replication protein
MLDTLALRSPAICPDAAAAIERHLRTRLGVYNATGEVEYEFCSGSLPGSWASSIAVNVCRDEWVSVRRPGQKRPDVVKVACEPYLRVEGSVHKALLGHNVEGGPLEPLPAARWFLADVSRRVGLELPQADTWCFDRLDWSEVYNLGNYEAVEAYLNAMSQARYPRRKVLRYSSECVLFPGTTTAFKAYHKGPEFTKHSWRKLATSAEFALSSVEKLQHQANCLLRFECSIKAKKLMADYSGKRPCIHQVSREYLEQVHDRESARVLREGKGDMETVRKTADVEARLYQVYDDRLAAVLYGTWLKMAARGEESLKRAVSARTFYRQRKQLQDAGIAWTGSDVHVAPTSAIPADFSPVRNSRYRLTQEDPRVTLALAPYAA